MKMVDDYKAMVDKDYSEVLGQLEGDWKRDGKGESAIGNFVADATREAAGADIGVANSSGIRKDLSAGPIRKQDLFEISPFRNVLCTFTLTGKMVREIVQRHVNALADGRGSLQLSGITCTWKRENSTPVLMSVNVGGKPLKDDASYMCATNDFIINQADKYLGITPPRVTYTSTTMLQTLIDKVKKEKTLHSLVENRMQESR
jgi:2',3'-cyclic-nucleotide 2'-phosphodiesterase (5'-nucleotidase family)